MARRLSVSELDTDRRLPTADFCNRGVQSLSKTKKEQRLARIEKAVLKIINSTPMSEPFVDNPIYKRLMKERDNLLGI